jgi:ABC-type multidrug transport system permease subunit
MQQLSRAVPHSWALLGLQELVRGGGGIASIALNLAVLGLFGIVLMTLAVWRFRRSIAG